MRQSIALFLAVLVALVVATPAMAAEADDAAAGAARDGFYVERGASITESDAGRLVGEMRSAGEGFYLVVLSEEPAAGAVTFADNVQFQLGQGLVLVVAPETIGYAGVGEFFDETELERALDAAFDSVGSDFDVAAAFVTELTGVAVGAPADPVPVSTTIAVQPTQAPQASGGGGGSGFIWFIVIIAGLGLFLWWMMRRSKARREQVDDDRLNKARYVIQEQLNDVANDILAMEDEVRVADNDRASDFYEQASRTYNDATEDLPKTNTAQGLVDLSNRLDVAIWQLDSAEAILDDKPLPDRPEPKRLEQPRSATAAPPPPPADRRPTYQRRSTRRSSPGGGGLMDLLIMVGGSVLTSRRRSSRRPSSGGRSGGGFGGLGDMFRRGSRSSQQQTPPRPSTPSSSGRRSNPVPGPGRPATPSAGRRSRAPKPRSSRGTSGRVRSGRKRRRRG